MASRKSPALQPNLNMPSQPTCSSNSVAAPAAPPQSGNVDVNANKKVSNIDETELPLQFHDFVKFSNAKDVLSKDLEEKIKGVVMDRLHVKRYIRIHYLFFYTRPEWRCVKPLKFIEPNEECPPGIRELFFNVPERFAHPLPGGEEFVLSPQSKRSVGSDKQAPGGVGAQSEKQIHSAKSSPSQSSSYVDLFQRMASQLSSRVPSNVRTPVSLEYFKAHTHWEKLVDKVIWHFVSNDESRFVALQLNETFRERIICNYFKEFYMCPDIRNMLMVQLKPCPRLIKEKLLQINTTCSENDSVSDDEEPNMSPSTSASKIQPLEAESREIEEPPTKRRRESVESVPTPTQHKVKPHKGTLHQPTLQQFVKAAQAKKHEIEAAAAWPPVKRPKPVQTQTESDALYAPKSPSTLPAARLPMALPSATTTTTTTTGNQVKCATKLTATATQTQSLPKAPATQSLDASFARDEESQTMLNSSAVSAEVSNQHKPKSIPTESPKLISKSPESGSSSSASRAQLIDESKFPVTFDEFITHTNVLKFAQKLIKQKREDVSWNANVFADNIAYVNDIAHKLYVQFYISPESRQTKLKYIKILINAVQHDGWLDMAKRILNEPEQSNVHEAVQAKAAPIEIGPKVYIQSVQVLNTMYTSNQPVSAPMELFFREVDKRHSFKCIVLNCNGLRLDILRAVMQMSLEEFAIYTRIDNAPDIYDNFDVLKRCYHYAIVDPQIWPINLYMRLIDLLGYLKTKTIVSSRPDLLNISPKLLHWSDLMDNTDIDETVHKIIKYTSHSSNSDNTLDEQRENYYERCWEHDQWFWRVPNVTDPEVLSKLNTTRHSVWPRNELNVDQTPQAHDECCVSLAKYHAPTTTAAVNANTPSVPPVQVSAVALDTQTPVNTSQNNYMTQKLSYSRLEHSATTNTSTPQSESAKSPPELSLQSTTPKKISQNVATAASHMIASPFSACGIRSPTLNDATNLTELPKYVDSLRQSTPPKLEGLLPRAVSPNVFTSSSGSSTATQRGSLDLPTQLSNHIRSILKADDSDDKESIKTVVHIQKVDNEYPNMSANAIADATRIDAKCKLDASLLAFGAAPNIAVEIESTNSQNITSHTNNKTQQEIIMLNNLKFFLDNNDEIICTPYVEEPILVDDDDNSRNKSIFSGIPESNSSEAPELKDSSGDAAIIEPPREGSATIPNTQRLSGFVRDEDISAEPSAALRTTIPPTEAPRTQLPAPAASIMCEVTPAEAIRILQEKTRKAPLKTYSNKRKPKNASVSAISDQVPQLTHKFPPLQLQLQKGTKNAN